MNTVVSTHHSKYAKKMARKKKQEEELKENLEPYIVSVPLTNQQDQDQDQDQQNFRSVNKYFDFSRFKTESYACTVLHWPGGQESQRIVDLNNKNHRVRTAFYTRKCIEEGGWCEMSPATREDFLNQLQFVPHQHQQ